MMPRIVKIICAADGRTKTPHDGRYVVKWNPHVRAGTLAVDSTSDRAKARRFYDGAEFLEWKTISNIQRKRPWDGKLNRPLTALNIETEEVPE